MCEDDPFLINNRNDYMKKELCNLYKTNKFVDCVFLLDEEKVHAHRLILAINSPVFERMLYGPLSSNEIKITDIDIFEFRQMLEFIYLSNVQIISIPNAWKLLYVSCKYFLFDLYNLCVKFILNNLSITSLLLSYEYAEFFNLKSVIKKCQNDIVHFPIEAFSDYYHMQPSTFGKVLLLICPVVSSDTIKSLINSWINVECEFKNYEKSECNKVKIMNETGLSKFIINIFQKCCDEKNDFDALFVPPIHYLKLRTEYKIDRLVPFRNNCSFTTHVKTNQTVLISGIALQIGEARLPCLSKCWIIIKVFKSEEKLYETKILQSNYYIKFSKSVILAPGETYKFIVTYYVDSDIYCGVTSYYVDSFLTNTKNGIVFEFFDDPKGSVIKGFSFYLF